MSGEPKYSIVIPTHDTSELVLRCLGSLNSPGAGARDMEIIVVDDGSSDGSSEKIRRRYPEIRLLRNERAEGFSRAAGTGLENARGEFLLLLNSDTRMPPGSLDALVSYFSSHPEPKVIGAQLLDPDGRRQWSGGSFPTALWLFALVSGIGRLRAEMLGRREIPGPSAAGGCRLDWVSGAAMAFGRDVWNKIGPFDHGFAFYVQDLDFCYRAGKVGIPSILLPEFRVFHELGGTVRFKDGAVASVEPEKLWPDLLRFVQMYRSPAQARRTRRLMLIGARVRLGLRAWRGLWMKGDAGHAWREDTERFRRAAARLSRNAASS